MTQDEYQREAEGLRRKLVAEACGYLHDADEAEDAVQDALLRLWRLHDTLRSPMAAMARVVVRNICLDRLRRARPTAGIGLASEVAIADDDGQSTRDEAIDRMLSVIEGLPPKQRLVIRLRHTYGLDFKDIAMLTGMSEVAARKTLSRARLAVRTAYLKRYKEEEDE